MSDAAATSSYTERFAYDDACNVVNPARVDHGRTAAHVHTRAGQQPPRAPPPRARVRAYAYDANGNVAEEGADRHFEWDHADRLRSFRVQQGTAHRRRTPSTCTTRRGDS